MYSFSQARYTFYDKMNSETRTHAIFTRVMKTLQGD